MPGEARLDLQNVHVVSVKHDRSHSAPVLIDFVPEDADLLAKDQAREIFLRNRAKLLLQFRGVDSLEANVKFFVVLIEHGDGVAVVNVNHLAFDNQLYVVGYSNLRLRHWGVRNWRRCLLRNTEGGAEDSDDEQERRAGSLHGGSFFGNGWLAARNLVRTGRIINNARRFV